LRNLVEFADNGFVLAKSDKGKRGVYGQYLWTPGILFIEQIILLLVQQQHENPH